MFFRAFFSPLFLKSIFSFRFRFTTCALIAFPFRHVRSAAVSQIKIENSPSEVHVRSRPLALGVHISVIESGRWVSPYFTGVTFQTNWTPARRERIKFRLWSLTSPFSRLDFERLPRYFNYCRFIGIRSLCSCLCVYVVHIWRCVKGLAIFSWLCEFIVSTRVLQLGRIVFATCWLWYLFNLFYT